MAFLRYDDAATEYQGESFTRTLLKKNGTAWEANEIADYSLVDEAGLEVDSGNLTKVNGDLGLKFEVSATDTTSLLGSYILIVYLRDTGNADFADIIARYTMTYKEIKAD